MKKNISVAIILSAMILGAYTFVFSKEIKSLQERETKEETYHVTTKRVLLDTKTIEKWIMPEQCRDGYSSHQDGFSVYYSANGNDTVKFPVSLTYGTVSVTLPRGEITNPTKSGVVYKMEIPGNGISYVTLIKNIVEVRQYGIYKRTNDTSSSWELVDIEEETELSDQIFRRVEANNLPYYDYI